MLTLLCWLSLPASALRPAPDVRAEVESVLAGAVARAATEDLAAAVSLAGRIESRVGPFGAVRYERALALYQAGELKRARTAYDDVLALVPDHAGALYDRGELALLAGDRDAARRDLEAAAKLRPDHWVVAYRLAQIACEDGRYGDTETHLLDALHRGLDLGMLVSDPAWRPLMKVPDARRTIERMVVVYGSDALLKELESVP